CKPDRPYLILTLFHSTGASGYIGGDILSVLIAKHPEHKYRLLVRNEQSQKQILAAYPSVVIVSGGLDDIEVITEESANADVIIHNADSADHLAAAQAIARGAIEGHSPDRPVYWLHTSGAGVFSHFDDENNTYGERSEETYDDMRDIHDITSLPDYAFHRTVEKAVLDAGAQNPDILKVAIISPTTVYGTGRGPCSRRSRQIYVMAEYILGQNRIPVIGRGQAIGSHIHVESLSAVYIQLFELALQGRREGLYWGAEAYYLAEQGEHCWGEVAHSIGQIAVEKGFLPPASKEIVLDKKSAYDLAGFEATSWGHNMRCRATRARSILGWQPAGISLNAELPQIVEEEYQRLKVRSLSQ
ncbi:nucleoside-diphosphate-sugar epimerase, partial [Penicillium paradoxum]|uniref:nucleoside-diphosphate-sugar epimerase n=1 Tax=Penicillium paradoxum TaxID=176176 RepID=UPI002549B86B